MFYHIKNIIVLCNIVLQNCLQINMLKTLS